MTLTRASLQHLVRLCRAATDGAPAELERVLLEPGVAEGLAATLGWPPGAVPTRPDAFVPLFERREKDRRLTSRDAARAEADTFARELGLCARPADDGFDLDPKTLDRLGGARGFDELVFVGSDATAVLERARLVAVMRELRTTTVERAHVHLVRGLTLSYRTSRSRGRLRLELVHRAMCAARVHVNLEDPPSLQLAAGAR